MLEQNNEVKVVEIDSDSINNLFVFLDRVEIKGMKEIKAMNIILDSIYQAKTKQEEPQTLKRDVKKK